MIRHFVFLLFFTSSLLSLAQTREVDSLKSLLKKDIQDTTRRAVLMALSEKAPDNEWPGYNELLMTLCKNKLNTLSKNDPNRKRYLIALAYGHNNLAYLTQNNGNYAEGIKNSLHALQLQKEADDKPGMANSSANLGALYQRSNELIKALEYHEMSLKLHQEINNPIGVISCYNHIGSIMKHQGNLAKAISYYEKSLRISTENKDEKGIATSLYNIALMYLADGDIEKASNYAFKSLEHLDEKKNKEGLGFTYNIIGGIFLERKDYNKALEYFEKSLALRILIGDKRSIGMSYKSIGGCYMRMGNSEKAMEYFNKSLTTNTEIGDEEGIASNLLSIGDIQAQKKQNKQAFDSYLKALKLSQETGYTNLIKDAAFKLHQITKSMGDYKNSLTYHQLFVEIKDKINSEDNKKALLQSEFRLEYEKKEQALKLEQEKKDAIVEQATLRKQSELEKQKAITYSFMAGSVLLIALVFLVFRNLRQSKIANRIISEQKQEVELQKTIIEEKQKEVMDSINYAKRIQYTLLAHNEFLNANIPNHFIYFNPKDIVSGDFYWATKKGNKFYLAVCDSTGHGVPGAFMSLLNIGFLTEAINEKGIEQPNAIFNFVRQRLIDNISKEGQKDGFDGILICIETTSNSVPKVSYAAANNKPVLIHNGELTELPNDRMPVGMGERKNDFNLYTIDVQLNDSLYLYTDGYADQFGGEKGKKFKYKTLNELIIANTSKPLADQCTTLRTTFENWKGNLEQVDDVCIIGIRF